MSGGERALVARILERLGRDPESVEVGPGDDAAVVRLGERRLVLTVDTQRESVHFESAWLDPEALGRRAFAVAASDVGAMGGAPVWALSALGLPPSADRSAVAEAVSAGIAAAAREAGAALIGGDVSRSDRLDIALTVIGLLAPGTEPLRRSGARPGNECWLFGELGHAAAGRALLAAAERRLAGPAADAARRAYRDPRPPLGLGPALAASGAVRALMDVSDGLGIDLARMCAASGCSARIERPTLADPPLEELARQLGADALAWAVAGGDDYALLAAVEPGAADTLATLAGEHEVRGRRVGMFVAGGSEPVLVEGDATRPLTGGWDPFGDRSGEGP